MTAAGVAHLVGWLAAARLIAGHVAYSTRLSEDEPADGMDWLGGWMVGLVSGWLWPVLWLVPVLGLLPKVGAERAHVRGERLRRALESQREAERQRDEQRRETRRLEAENRRLDELLDRELGADR